MRARRTAAAASLAVLVLLLGACVERDGATASPTAAFPTPTPRATEPPATQSPTQPATAPPLTEEEVGSLLRRAICWYDDPARAASCLPPGGVTIAAIEAMGRSGDARFVAPLVDMRWLALGWERWVSEALEALTGLRFDDPAPWYRWVAEQRPPLPEGYAEWKGRLLSFVHPLFATMIDGERDYDLRPELLIWAGVSVDEVAPLRQPAFVHRLEERYLAPDDVVFGLVLGGQARAYPRRIVAWHRLVIDEVGGVPVVLAFCAPCGGAAAYDPRAGGVLYRLGAAGLVYDARSLLYDEQTTSLWDAFTGRPVAGPLLEDGIKLDEYPLVTTTWADWSSRHPNTAVLDLDTGYVRDYSAGAALREELGSPASAFPAAEADPRLPPKEVVLGLELGGEARAYRLDDVRARRIVHDTLGGTPVVLLSEGPGKAIAVYHADGLTLASLEGAGDGMTVVDEEGERWWVNEHALISTLDGRQHAGLARREAYWFAWSATHPQTTIWGE